MDIAIGWSREQWILALQFYDRPCEKLEDFLGCRIYWWAHWNNAPVSAQFYFIRPRAAHRDMAAHLFQDLAPLLCRNNLSSED